VVGHDGVVAILHVFDGGHQAMALARAGACGAGVHLVEAESMCPAVIHADAIVSDNVVVNSRQWQSSGRCTSMGHCQQWHQLSRLDDGSIGTVKANLPHSEFAQMFLVFASEM